MPCERVRDRGQQPAQVLAIGVVEVGERDLVQVSPDRADLVHQLRAACRQPDQPHATVGGVWDALDEFSVDCRPSEAFRLTTVEGTERIDAGSYDLLELRPAPRLETANEAPLVLDGPGPVVPPPDATVRHFRLQGHNAINGQSMDMTRIDEVVPAGAVEIWEIENNVYSHNFHIHGVEFTILDRDGQPPHPWETGRKDTVHVPDKSRVRVAVQFSQHTDPRHPYMYHCHILRHEDAGMMGQFVVVEPGTEDAVARTLPDHGPSEEQSPHDH